MAIVHPEWTYWSAIFVAMALSPIAADTLFTIPNLVTTQIFPKEIHGVAGGLFNTVTQLGNSVGLAVAAVVAAEVRKARKASGDVDASALLESLRAKS